MTSCFDSCYSVWVSVLFAVHDLLVSEDNTDDMWTATEEDVFNVLHVVVSVTDGNIRAGFSHVSLRFW